MWGRRELYNFMVSFIKFNGQHIKVASFEFRFSMNDDRYNSTELSQEDDIKPKIMRSQHRADLPGL